MFDLIDGGFIIFMLGLAVAAIVIFLVRKGIQKLLHPVRKIKVQVAAIEMRDQNLNATARKLSTTPMNSGGRNSMQISHLAHAMVDDMLFTFYQLDNENKTIRLKIQANVGSNMAKVGDVGFVTYQDGWILGFEKTGNINDK